jgi:hypothetical protein
MKYRSCFNPLTVISVLASQNKVASSGYLEDTYLESVKVSAMEVGICLVNSSEKEQAVIYMSKSNFCTKQDTNNNL